MDVKTRSLGVFELIVVKQTVPAEKIDTQKLEDAVKQAMDKGVKNICIDFSSSGNIEFPVVEILKHTNRDLLHKAGRLAILSTDVKITNQLDDLGISNYLRIYQSEEEISADSKEILRQTESYYMGNMNVSDSSSLAIDLEAALKKSGLVDEKPKSAKQSSRPAAEGGVISKNEFDFLLGSSLSEKKSKSQKAQPVDDDDDLMDTVVEKTPSPQEVKVIRKEEITAGPVAPAVEEKKPEIRKGYRRPGTGEIIENGSLQQQEPPVVKSEPPKRQTPLDRFEMEESAILENRPRKKMSPLVAALITGLSLLVVLLMAWGLGLIGGKSPDPSSLQPTKYKELDAVKETQKDAVPSTVKPSTDSSSESAVNTPSPSAVNESEPAPVAQQPVKPEYKALPKKESPVAAVPAKPKTPRVKDKDAEDLSKDIDAFLNEDPPPKPAVSAPTPAPAPPPPPPPPAAKVDPAPAPKPEVKAESKPAASAPQGSVMGSIFISSSPPTAEILLNGNVIGVANRAPVELPTGNHTLLLRKDNLERSVEIQVFEGRNKPMFVKLQ